MERKQSEQETNNKAAAEIIPATQHILDNYDALSPAQKNVLWKLVLKKVSVYRGGPKRPFQVKIYPNLPQ